MNWLLTLPWWTYLTTYLVTGFGYAIIIERQSLHWKTERSQEVKFGDFVRRLLGLFFPLSQYLIGEVVSLRPDKSILGMIPIFWGIVMVIDIIISIFVLAIEVLAIVGMIILMAISCICSLAGSLIQRIGSAGHNTNTI